MGKFIRDFITETQAKTFAAKHLGVVIVHYDYDTINHKIIKTYRVKY